jgi:amino acid transporter
MLNVMGRNHVLPRAHDLAKLHPRFQTPIIATWLSGLLAVIFALALNQESLIALVSWGGLTAYLILNYSLIHRFFFKNETHDRKAWISAFLLPLLGMLLIEFVWMHFPIHTLISGAIFVLIGLILYWKRSKTGLTTSLHKAN